MCRGTTIGRAHTTVCKLDALERHLREMAQLVDTRKIVYLGQFFVQFVWPVNAISESLGAYFQQ